MNSHDLRPAFLTVLLLLLPAPARALSGQPIRFEPNVGQLGPLPRAVHFIARTGATTMLLDPAGATFTVGRGPVDVVRIAFDGASPAAQIDGVDPQPGVSNHLRGQDPAAWRTGVRGFARVRYREIRPGVDVVFHGDGGELEYDIVVRAPSRRMRSAGWGYGSRAPRRCASLPPATSGWRHRPASCSSRPRASTRSVTACATPSPEATGSSMGGTRSASSPESSIPPSTW